MLLDSQSGMKRLNIGYNNRANSTALRLAASSADGSRDSAGLTIRMSRRMKHVYPRAIRLAEQGRVDLAGLVSHRFRLDQAVEAFRLNAAYRDHVVKAIIQS